MGPMRVPAQIPPTIFETFPRVSKQLAPRVSASAAPPARRINVSNTAPSQPRPLSLTNYKIENTSFDTAADVSLSDSQKVITGSILDLFGGQPSLRKLQLWTDDASLVDPLTVSEGRKQYAAQWYGLKNAFSDIESVSSTTVSDNNPIELQMKNKYVVDGIKDEQTVTSKVKIFTEGDGDAMRVKRVEDHWDSVSEGAFVKARTSLNSTAGSSPFGVPRSIEEEERGQ